MRAKHERPALLLSIVACIFIGIVIFQLYSLFSLLLQYYDTQQYMHRKLAIPLEGMYYGYYMPDLLRDPNHPQVKILPEEQPTLTLLFLDWANGHQLPIKSLYTISRQGIVPIVTWEPWDAQKKTVYQAEFAPSRITAGTFDRYIHEFAKMAADYEKPLLLRFAHEMNGDWYPWGAVNGNTPQDYIAMWRHVHDIFMQEGATNVLWVWSPNNTDNKGSAASVKTYYPGDMYVDWVGFSAFNWGEQSGYHWKQFRDIAEPIYSQLEFLNKPVLVAEVSSTNTGGIKEQWFDETLENGLAFFPNIKGVVFYNKNFGSYEFRLGAGMNETTVIQRHILHNRRYVTQLDFENR